MKEFDEHFVESLLEGGFEANVKWIGEIGVYFLSK
jgi:hypothetical protein